jgi:hypothetical protein
VRGSSCLVPVSKSVPSHRSCPVPIDPVPTFVSRWSNASRPAWATTVPGCRRAPRTPPLPAGFRQPTAPSVGQRTPSFYAPGNNSDNSLDPKLDWDRGGSAWWARGRRMGAEVVSPRWGSEGIELVRPRDPRPALRSDLGYKMSRPVGAEETSHAAGSGAFNVRLRHAFC